MSGHSKWSTIKRAKGAADIKRGLTFTKVANAITIAAKLGGSADPSSNPRLRMVLEQARSVNMPKDNIQRAIDKGLGNLPGQEVEEVLYEGFGPGKIAIIAEGVTDNRLRTNQEVKNLFERSGGHLGGQGSVLYMFDKVGEIKTTSKGGNSEDEMLELMDTGAQDLEDFESDGVKNYLLYTSPTKLFEVSNKVAQLGYSVDTAELVYKPNLTTKITEKETAERVINFIERLEENDDVQKVYANFEFEDNLL
ncbi:MAG: hypothetical protein ACD_30C00040G0033 [uncultured bacterium]|uniref:Probable transcriptional regulatory protein US19_C0008G0006 n=3 Tax=Candidatus Daviesiibacteriota TaxID=1752718 RepID=A0A0G0ETJ9_9BACT|nr:MAG: hypothetical protein ACD_30C00040G0033 [uncultured bacterium]KKQ10163.1 MAG: transcriptional regulator [Candidatus Daviesbacteria bacterium GW2011_GWB1_36_5]OGE17159.1 MAG: hypothetical protein A2858_00445 [Candidatus Daviesbacteria bacterium RIFCSPHIGHO2_01_FULL_36_37]OGE35940.1 MAG: hypothetical protein A3E66_01440 [Candidatus Daviesbacteria bacterium RIFCSPHIGHO2_12_FULL_37_16]